MLSSVCLSYFSILFYDAKLILFSENTKHLGKKTYRNRMESQNETNNKEKITFDKVKYDEYSYLCKHQIHKHIFYMRLNNIKKVFLASAALLSAMSMSAAERFVSFKQGDLLINANDKVEIYMDANDCRGVSYAANALVRDISKVSGSQATITSNRKATILVGTIGHSASIDQLIKQKRINGNLLKGKREKFIITVVDKQLVIAGSDRRGTIYGIYELSQQMGVSPWYDWADVPVEHHDSIFVNKGIYTDGEPAVRYRGIFLNDEAPCLTSWVKNTYGTEYGDHRFYQRVVELVLRLRGNMMWPAMWGWAL